MDPLSTLSIMTHALDNRERRVLRQLWNSLAADPTQIDTALANIANPYYGKLHLTRSSLAPLTTKSHITRASSITLDAQDLLTMLDPARWVTKGVALYLAEVMSAEAYYLRHATASCTLPKVLVPKCLTGIEAGNWSDNTTSHGGMTFDLEAADTHIPAYGQAPPIRAVPRHPIAAASHLKLCLAHSQPRACLDGTSMFAIPRHIGGCHYALITTMVDAHGLHTMRVCDSSGTTETGSYGGVSMAAECTALARMVAFLHAPTALQCAPPPPRPHPHE
jgi:hypothetical protein